MPYTVKPVDDGYKVCKRDEPDKCFSKKPLPKKRAEAQLKAIAMSERLRGGSTYQITDYTKQKAKEIDVEVRPSHDPKKKIDVYSDGILIKSIGARGYSDYPSYIIEKGQKYADNRRRLYYIRHRGDTLGEYLSLWLLW
jgi:hypothetical protein